MVELHHKITLPGFGLPVNHQTRMWYSNYYSATRFRVERMPNAITDWTAQPMTIRERNMLSLMNQITDKTDWRRKVFDEEIVQKWREEALTNKGHGFTDKMFDYCVQELRAKAEMHKDADMVAVLDTEATIVKTDGVSQELKQELQLAIKPLEDVPELSKDWHPGSNGKVLDLVHPSLFPLVYGQTRILPHGTVAFPESPESCGQGDLVPIPPYDDLKVEHMNVSLNWGSAGKMKFWSKKFQWLPSDVKFNEKGEAKFTSYINNLHPIRHRPLYSVIEKFIEMSVPLWSEVLKGLLLHTQPRINFGGVDYDIPEYGQPLQDSEEEQEDWERANRTLVMPDAADYNDRPLGNSTNLIDMFQQNGCQVIVKLANIHLAPENPTYEGGSWHIEGQLNEHICATALYYFDSDNLTDSFLAFRQKVSGEDIGDLTYGHDDHDGLEYILGIENLGPQIQSIGKVLTKEGRLLAFPNVLQHQVQSFELKDKSKPGHRKILALFLIDPFQRIISTANVPPQQKEWWKEVVTKQTQVGQLPPELVDNIMNEVRDFPFSLEEAKKIREELMAERSAFVDYVIAEMENKTFNLCEH